MRTIYKAGFQLVMMRFVQVITLVTSVGAVFAGVMIIRLQDVSTDPADQLHPIWGAGFIVVGFAFAAGLWYYCQVYISRVEISDDSRRLRVTFPGIVFPHQREFGVEEIASATFHDGYMRTGGMTVNAPWETIRLHNGGRGMILDVQGDYVDEAAIDEYLLGRRRRWHKMPTATSGMRKITRTKKRRKKEPLPPDGSGE